MHEPCAYNRLEEENRALRSEITELRHRAYARELQARRLAAIVEASRDAIWSWTPDGTINSWNAEAQRIFQYAPSEIIGRSLLTLVPEELLEAAQNAIERLRSGGFFEQHQTVRRRKDGKRVPVELTVFPFKEDGVLMGGVATICRDISMRAGQEKALRESEERFNRVFRVAPIPLCISTLSEGRYLEVNDALLRMTGYDRSEIINRTAHELQVFANAADSTRLREGLSGAEGVRELEVPLRGKAGEVRTNVLNADIIELNGVPCILTACLDIDERKKREARLQFLDRLVRQTLTLSSADAILKVTTRLLAEELHGSVCAYADMDPDEDGFTIRGNWNAPGRQSIVGHYHLRDFGARAVATLKAGEPLVLHDIAQELPPHEAQTFLGIGLHATVCVPLIKSNRLTALMAVHDAQPRQWSADEVRLICDVTDRSWAHVERVRLHEELRESERRYRGAVITGRIASWETDLVSRTRRWTREGMDLFGIELPGGVGVVGGEGDEFRNALHPEDKHLMTHFHTQADRVDEYPAEYRILKPDGSVRWMAGRGRVVARLPDGRAATIANMVVDITERKVAEENIKLLMREVSHRSKNLLAVVQAIAIQTARGSTRLADFNDAFASRLRSLAASLDLLVRENWAGVALRDLLEQQLHTFAPTQHNLSMSGPEILLSHQATQAVGLAVHELATNALKYGAWSVEHGRIAVEWFVQDQILEVVWRELGAPKATAPPQPGFGTFVITTMISQATDGEVETAFDEDGFRWRLRMPIAQSVRT